MLAELTRNQNLSLPSSLTKCIPAEQNRSSFKLPSNDILTLTEEQPTLIKDAVYYMYTVIFKVEDHLFKVPTHYFSKASFFAPKFVSPDAWRRIGDVKFIELEDVTPVEFRTLLRFIYPIQSNCLQKAPPAPTTAEWITILKLSTQWMMLDVRRVAISALSSARIPPVDRAVLAREYKVDSWLRSAYFDLAKTALSMTQQDMEKIGMMAAFKIHKARERYMTGTFSHPPIMRDPSWCETDRRPPTPVDNFFRSKETDVKRSAVERVLLAREHGVAEWLREAFIELIKRREPLTMDESKTLGFDTAIRLYSARERLLDRSATAVSTLSNDSPVDQELREELGALITHQPVERVVLARRYGVTEWLRQSFSELTERSEAISVPEAEALGSETAIRLASARDAYTVKFNGFRMCQDIATVKSSVEQELASELSIISDYGPVERVLIAREAGVDEWLYSALDELVERKETVTDDEAVVLGLDTCIQLCRFRLKNLEGYSSPTFTGSSQINAEFQVELGEIRDAGERYIQPDITLKEEEVHSASLTAGGVSNGPLKKKKKKRKM